MHLRPFLLRATLSAALSILFSPCLLLCQQPQPSPEPAPPPASSAKAEAGPVIPTHGPGGQPYSSDHGQRLYEHLQNDGLQFNLLLEDTEKKKQALQQDYTSTDQQFRAWQEDVRKANNWGPDVQYDAARDTWQRVPAPKPSEPAKAASAPSSDAKKK